LGLVFGTVANSSEKDFVGVSITFMQQKIKWWREGKPRLEWPCLKTLSSRRPEWRTCVRGALPWPLPWFLRGREGRRSHSAGCVVCGCKILLSTVS